MKKISLKELAFPLIKAIDSFNYLLKSHHRRTAVIAYNIAVKMGMSRDDIIDLVVAASLHDIGALSVQERDMLIQEDVVNPEPHCVMGYKMLSTFDMFIKSAEIIKHHHIRYDKSGKVSEEVHPQSYIIHLADRVDILISQDKFILDQKMDIINSIIEKKGSVFHPEVCDAFAEVAKADIFWIEINNLTMEQLFSKIDFISSHELTKEQIMQFALTISRIIDFRSRFTAGHSYTVGQLAFKIGEMLGLDDDFCTKLLVAGYLHDIGKIGIDTGYIEKEGPLTDEEFNQVKLHSYYSGQILSELNNSEWFADVVNWAKHHHEKTNGSGYPFAIKGDDIDLGTKIIEYADIISALTENRPYRKGMTIEEAFKIIEDNFSGVIDDHILQEIEEHADTIRDIVAYCREASGKAYSNRQ
jgi:HD-GYP domain-containing protein (c-di-GMP phosphodiesterase class II)